MSGYEKSYRGKKVLITGGLGFIGSTLAHRLIPLEAKVTIVDSMIPHYGGNFFNVEGIRDQVNISITDIRDRFSMNFLVRDQDIIFNMAGTLSHVDSMRDPITDLEVNCKAQLSLLESCRNFNPDVKILFAGTRNQYGRAQYLPVDENHPMIPIDVNGINNIAGEWYHILYNNVYGIRACSLRMVNCFGPRHQMRHPRQGVLNWFIRQIIDGEKVKLFGTGEQIRDTNYVDDVVEAFLMAGASKKADGEAFNLGGSPISLKKFVEKVIEVHGTGNYEVVPFPNDRRPIEVGDYVADYKKSKRVLGWEPKVNLEEGIRKTLDYYKKHKTDYWKTGEVLEMDARFSSNA